MESPTLVSNGSEILAVWEEPERTFIEASPIALRAAFIAHGAAPTRFTLTPPDGRQHRGPLATWSGTRWLVAWNELDVRPTGPDLRRKPFYVGEVLAALDGALTESELLAERSAIGLAATERVGLILTHDSSRLRVARFDPQRLSSVEEYVTIFENGEAGAPFLLVRGASPARHRRNPARSRPRVRSRRRWPCFRPPPHRAAATSYASLTK